VFRASSDHRRGRLVAGPLSLPCALGASGPVQRKREGDGATPVGRFRVLGAFYRPDRLGRPSSAIPLRAIRPDDGWCDAAGDRRYNQAVRLPYPARHERMWREDGLYDLVLDLDYNRHPAVPGRGSAVFLHIAGAGFRPTEGCVALEVGVIRRVLALIGPRTVIAIMAPAASVKAARTTAGRAGNRPRRS
jgi:L,D-peptidoglycan transpeptidase YkuD (ErfK/YbiS/YcfS/YnhG family)